LAVVVELVIPVDALRILDVDVEDLLVIVDVLLILAEVEPRLVLVLVVLSLTVEELRLGFTTVVILDEMLGLLAVGDTEILDELRETTLDELDAIDVELLLLTGVPVVTVEILDDLLETTLDELTMGAKLVVDLLVLATVAALLIEVVNVELTAFELDTGTIILDDFNVEIDGDKVAGLLALVIAEVTKLLLLSVANLLVFVVLVALLVVEGTTELIFEIEITEEVLRDVLVARLVEVTPEVTTVAALLILVVAVVLLLEGARLVVLDFEVGDITDIVDLLTVVDVVVEGLTVLVEIATIGFTVEDTAGATFTANKVIAQSPPHKVLLLPAQGKVHLEAGKARVIS